MISANRPLEHGSTDHPAGGWRLDVLALGLLALAALAFFWPVLFRGAWIPHGGGDLVSLIYPMYRFAAASLHSGEIPLWNPYLYAGAPFIADNQSGVFYPFNLVLFLLNPDFPYSALQGLVIWHFFFAGAGMYACLRWFRPAAPINRPAALIGALGFMFSGFFITHIGNLNLIAVAAWLPLAFGAYHRAVGAMDAYSRLRWAVAGGFALGIGSLAGHGQSTFLIAFYLGLYSLFRAISDRSVRPLLLLALAGATALGAAAVSLFPALESIRYTLRAEFDFARSVNYSLPWQGLTGIAAPGFYGRGVPAFWGNWPRVEYGYAGVLPWFLAATAAVKRPTRDDIFFTVALFSCLLLALGANTPLYELVFGRLPVVPFQVPARFVLLADFSLLMLAALATDYLLKVRPPRRSGRLVLAVSAISSLLLLAYLFQQADVLSVTRPDRRPQMLSAVYLFALFAAGSWLLVLALVSRRAPPYRIVSLAVLWLAIDLVSQGQGVELEWNYPAVGMAQDSPALAYLKSDPGIHRIDIAPGSWQESLPQIEGLYSIGGVFNPLHLINYSVYVGSVGYRGSPLYNLLGVKYVVGGKGEPPADTTFVVPVFDDDPDVTVYLNTQALPRAMVLYEAEVVSSHDAAFEAIHQADFDPQRTLVLEDGVPLRQETGKADISILRYDLNQALFEVSTTTTAYFLLTDINHPHWKAFVDEQEVPILTANYAFRAVYLEPGRHQVRFRFRPPGWQVGLALTAVTWSGVGLLTLRSLKRQYKRVE